MDLLKLDQHIRYVKHDDKEEWLAYSTRLLSWFSISAEKAARFISMMSNLDVKTAMDWCRANCFNKVGYDPITKKVLSERKI